jgi:hypothetical protein
MVPSLQRLTLNLKNDFAQQVKEAPKRSHYCHRNMKYLLLEKPANPLT